MGLNCNLGPLISGFFSINMYYSIHNLQLVGTLDTGRPTVKLYEDFLLPWGRGGGAPIPVLFKSQLYYHFQSS